MGVDTLTIAAVGGTSARFESVERELLKIGASRDLFSGRTNKPESGRESERENAVVAQGVATISCGEAANSFGKQATEARLRLH